MNKTLIINAVPVYSEAPVSLLAIEADFPSFMSKLSASGYESLFLLLPAKEDSLWEKIKAESSRRDVPLTIIGVADSSSFLYLVPQVSSEVIKDKTPIIRSKDPNVTLITAEEFIGKENKTLFVTTGEVTKKIVSKNFQLSDLSEDAKGIYLGYPDSMMILGHNLDDPLCITTDLVIVYTQSDCMLQKLLEITLSYHGECCGQCVFGYEGLFQISAILSDMVNKKGKSDDLNLVFELCENLINQSLCDIGQKAGQVIKSSIIDFKVEIEEHITKKSCSSLSCNRFVTFHILPDLCTGCTDCQEVCDDDAIASKQKFVHVIDQDECSQCGNCQKVCEYGAVIKAGTVKPITPKKPVPCTAK